MSTVKKLAVFGLVALVAGLVETVWLSALEPRLSAALAVAQLNGGNDAFLRLRLFETYRAAAHTVVVAVIVLALVWLVRPRQQGDAGKADGIQGTESMPGQTYLCFRAAGCSLRHE